jgi:uncharacterized tellurite resistance protein B-like protein
MNFTDFITHHGKRVSRDHFIHLVQIARIDGMISPPEMELLHKEGSKFGLTEPEIDKILNSEDTHNYIPPYSLKDKFEELYNIAEMILADDIITESEIRMIRRCAIAAGFSDETIEKLIKLLFDGIKKGEEEETLFHEFKKKHLFK